MCKLIRSKLDEKYDLSGGEGEIDVPYFGGHKSGKRSRGAEGKTPVLGMVERNRKVNDIAVPNVKTKTVVPQIENQIKKDALVSMINPSLTEFSHIGL